MTFTGRDPSALRRLNAGAVLHTLHRASTVLRADAAAADGQAGAMTVTELGAAVGVSRPTAEDIVDGLYKQGWVAEIEPDGSSRRRAGRPARRFRFRAGAGYVVGLDIGWDSVHALVTDLIGTVVGHHRAPVDVYAPAQVRLAVAKDAVVASLRAAGISTDLVLAAGVGTSGIVDTEGRALIEPIFPGWSEVNLAAEFRQYLDAPVSVHNDMNLGAVAERWRGAAQGADDVVYVHVGVRLGAGFLLAGRPYRGAHGASGEVRGETARTWMDAREQFLEKAAKPSASTSGGASALGPVSVFDDAASGDPAARDAVKSYVWQLVETIEQVLVMLDPGVVVIGGEASRAGDEIAEPVRRNLAERCVFPPEVRVSPLGSDSVALGAVRVALDQVETRLFTEGDAVTAAAPQPTPRLA